MESYPIDLRIALKESGESFVDCSRNDEQDQEIIQSKLEKMKQQDQSTIDDVQYILKFLKGEEAVLYAYTTMSPDTDNIPDSKVNKYQSIMQKARVDKNRVLIFVRHLQITLIISMALFKVVSQQKMLNTIL